MVKESTGAKRIRLKSSYDGNVLWRNNVGVLFNDSGTPVRYGLCNDSKEMNRQIKSGDLIGITTITITPEMVGHKLGVFTSIETKHSTWVYGQVKRDAPHEQAQAKFAQIVRDAGGFAGFARNEQEYTEIVTWKPL